MRSVLVKAAIGILASGECQIDGKVRDLLQLGYDDIPVKVGLWIADEVAEAISALVDVPKNSSGPQS